MSIEISEATGRIFIKDEFGQLKTIGWMENNIYFKHERSRYRKYNCWAVNKEAVDKINPLGIMIKFEGDKKVGADGQVRFPRGYYYCGRTKFDQFKEEIELEGEKKYGVKCYNFIYLGGQKTMEGFIKGTGKNMIKRKAEKLFQ